MFETYKGIFDKRAESYHLAMLKCPRARETEFLNVIRLAGIRKGDVVCDVPSGGCYLSAFVEREITLISVETSREFIKFGTDSFSHQRLLCRDVSSIPLKSSSVDKIVSLAGMHHLEEKSLFYKEAHRLLKDGGSLGLADVREDSPPAKFLNEFLHTHNSMGHEGKFLDDETGKELEHAGFRVEYAGSMNSFWTFDSADEMAEYYKLLFGMDRAGCSEVLEGVKNYLGFEMRNGRCVVRWELDCFKAVK